MNAADFTFGIEIETHMPAGSVCPGPHGHGSRVTWLPAGWLADEDPSIVVPNHTRVKCEFVSPILKGAEGLRQVCEVIRKIKSMGGRVNDSCGIHVHVGFDKNNTQNVDRLLALVGNHEKALYAVTGTKNRERGVGSRHGTCWCKSVRRFGSAAAARTSYNGPTSHRYHVVNLTTSKPTAEFRVFSGSLNVVKVAGYIRLCVGIVQKAMMMKRACKMIQRATRSATRAAAGEGYAETLRLLGNITTLRDGTLDGEGIPSVKASKRIMREMARIYDRQA